MERPGEIALLRMRARAPGSLKVWELSTDAQQIRRPLRLDFTYGTSCQFSETSYEASMSRRRFVQCPNNPHWRSPAESPFLPWYPNRITAPIKAYCYRYPSRLDPRKDLGSQCNNIGNPVNAASGNKFEIQLDYRGHGAMPLEFSRTYNSHLWTDSAAPLQHHNARSTLGPNWRSAFDAWIDSAGSGRFATVHVNRPDGRALYFKDVQENGIYVPDGDVSDRLTKTTDSSGNHSGWRYTVVDSGYVETYDALGRLISISNRAGLTHTLTYGANGRVSSVSDDFGRNLTFTYNANNRLATLTDPAGQNYIYSYNAVGNLASVQHPGGTIRSYVYGEQTTGYFLSGIIDESNSRFSKYIYNGTRVRSTELAGGVNKFTFTYGTAGTTFSTTVADPRGTSRRYDFLQCLWLREDSWPQQAVHCRLR